MTCGWKGNRRLVDSHDHRTVGLELVFSAAVSSCSWEGNSRSGHVRDVQAVMSCAWEDNRRSGQWQPSVRLGRTAKKWRWSPTPTRPARRGRSISRCPLRPHRVQRGLYSWWSWCSACVFVCLCVSLNGDVIWTVSLMLPIKCRPAAFVLSVLANRRS